MFFFFMGQPVLKLTISNESIVSATAYAALISTLAEEYTALSPGRELGVAKVENGSIITYLADLAASSLNGLAMVGNAAESIRKLFDAVERKGHDAREGKIPARPNHIAEGLKSLEAISNTVAAVGGCVSLEIEAEKLKFTMDATEALRLRADGRLLLLPSSSIAATRPPPHHASITASTPEAPPEVSRTDVVGPI